MAIRIVKTEFDSSAVPLETILATIEKNRDRVRSVGAMVLTLSGILISASNAFILFIKDKKLGSRRILLVMGASVLCFVATAVLAVLSSFLRRKYAISSQAQFVSDVLAIFRSELFLLRCALICMFVGLVVMSGVICVFIR